MVLVQNWSFLHVFILGNRGQENVFYDILERPGKSVLRYSSTKKRLFRLYKQEVQKLEILRFFQRS